MIKKLAEIFSTITKKLEEVNEPTKTIGEFIKKPNSENENNQETAPV